MRRILELLYYLGMQISACPHQKTLRMVPHMQQTRRQFLKNLIQSVLGLTALSPPSILNPGSQSSNDWHRIIILKMHYMNALCKIQRLQCIETRDPSLPRDDKKGNVRIIPKYKDVLGIYIPLGPYERILAAQVRFCSIEKSRQRDMPAIFLNHKTQNRPNLDCHFRS
jgi:hypothetical protein